MPSSITVTQSTVLPNHQHHLNATLILNIILLALCLASVFYYVLRANVLAANDYKISSLRNELTQLTASNASLLAQQSTSDDPDAISAYAQEEHMVPATNISYIFADGRVALNR
ncbi:MAG TPA: hypothetical protein VFK07_00975 [Candidatus Paceibacterota bacterium]|nr:hypothetical protein [Candidatus Paceibacterota bacterium]